MTRMRETIYWMNGPQDLHVFVIVHAILLIVESRRERSVECISKVVVYADLWVNVFVCV